MTKKITIILMVVALLLVLSPYKVMKGGQAGTTLDAEKTATGFWEEEITYDWTIDKTVDPEAIDICSGNEGSVYYTITLIKTQVGEVDVYGVRGTITVHNGGAVATENLKLVDQVEYKTGAGQFQDLLGASQIIIPTTQLGPGETGYYDYEITFDPIEGATYRNSVKVTITNHSGHLGEEFGPEPKTGFSLPSEPTITYVDECVTLDDVLTVPSGFSANYQGGSPDGEYCNSTSFGYYVDITNVSATCDSYYDLTNTATITENDSGTTHSDGTSVAIYTCPCGGRCTLTIGYWKTHAGFTGRNPNRVSQYLPISLGSTTVNTATEAVNILSFQGQASNGINKLMAQLLGAKLNIANGADGSAVADTIAAADAFLTTYHPSDWSTLTKAQQKQVLQWMTTLDNYNNGLIGPGHCG